jgi:hypothetical protein
MSPFATIGSSKISFKVSILPVISASRLRPHPLAVVPAACWLSVPRAETHPGRIVAVREDGVLRWISGFSAFPKDLSQTVSVQVLRHPLSDDEVRLRSWREATSTAGIESIAAGAIWYSKLRLHMPEDIEAELFGGRGLTISEAARRLGVCRTSLHRHLRDQAARG